MNSGAAQTRKRGVERKKSWFRAYIIHVEDDRAQRTASII